MSYKIKVTNIGVDGEVLSFTEGSSEVKIKRIKAGSNISVNTTEDNEVEITGVNRTTTEITVTAFEAISMYDLLAVSSNGIVKADSSDTTLAGKIIGFAVETAEAGDLVLVALDGAITNESWSFTIGALLFAGTNGEITETAPETGFIQHVGIAITATTLRIQFGTPTLL